MSNNKMLIDATHPEETRVVVLRGGRVEEFDYESAARKLLRGNIYLAKVTRVEPALQAAFIDYGGNRHGFLAFNEIHPDYYQIPIADRQALLDEEAAAEAAEEAAVDARAEALAKKRPAAEEDEGEDDESEDDGVISLGGEDAVPAGDGSELETGASDDEASPSVASERAHDLIDHLRESPTADRTESPAEFEKTDESRDLAPHADQDDHGHHDHHDHDNDNKDASAPAPASVAPPVEQVGAEDALEEVDARPRRRARSYKIHEVIKRRQVILIQVVKEERGNKGAALTTYLSLAGRYTVLMPNTARGGGISRKITNPLDRKRLKAIAAELEVPEGMGLIIRTAGAARTKQEIKRDFEYLLRLWESVREMTLASTAPSLVYEEGNLIKRSIRDLYTKEIEEVVVAGPDAHREAKDFMRMLMPSHAKNVLAYESPEPLFTKFQIERQLNAMFSPYVTLRSGGYLVINQTEALVAVDVNSGKSTREFSIEETALNTNLEAADEIARQLKLRDLAGLIVVDFIDMEEKRNNRAVERRMKDALRFDRARIQVGRISHFGLLEMSRQRLRTGVLEGSTSQCPHCQGTGIIRSTESVALAVLRGIEDAILAGANTPLNALTTAAVALYILNNKRAFILDMEQRHGLPITVQGSDKMQGASFTIEKGAAPAQPVRRPQRAAVSMDWGFDSDAEEQGGVIEIEPEEGGGFVSEVPPDTDDEAESDGRGQRRGGRRRRRGRRSDHDARSGNGFSAGGEPSPALRRNGPAETGVNADSDDDATSPDEPGDGADPARNDRLADGEEGPVRRRRRGRRGGRRGRDRDRGGPTQSGAPDAGDTDGVIPSAATGDVADRQHREFDQAEIASAEAAVFARASGEPSNTRRNSAPGPAAHVDRLGSTLVDVPRVADQSDDTADQLPSTRRRGRFDRDDTPAPIEPRLERVLIRPDQTTAADAPVEDGKPTRKGWWQRKFGGE